MMSKKINKEEILELLKQVYIQGKQANIVDSSVVKEVKAKSDIF
jgi:hypothetical protein